MKNFIKHNRAFTLIELLVAIALIMIFAAIVIPPIQKARQRHQNISYKITFVANNNEPIMIYTNISNYYRITSGELEFKYNNKKIVLRGNYLIEQE